MTYLIAYLICMFLVLAFFYCASERRNWTAKDEEEDLEEQAKFLENLK